MNIINKVNQDKSFSIYSQSTNYQGENLSENLQFLILPTMNDFDISTSTIILNIEDIKNTDGLKNIYTLLPEVELYSDYLVYSFPITNEFTQTESEYKYSLTIIDSNAKIMKTGDGLVYVKKKPDTTVFVPTIEIDTVNDLVSRVATLEAGGGGAGGTVLYSTPYPVIQTIGGITAGKTYTNANINTVLNDLLFPYLAPQISLAASVVGGTREYGNSIPTLTLTATTVKRSNSITSIGFYKDDVLINSVTSPNISGGIETFTYSVPIVDSCGFTVKVSDGTQTVISNGTSYSFVYPIYKGSVIGDTPTELELKAMNKSIVTKGNQSFSYTINNERFCFAYPTVFGDLTSIKDPNNFEIISTFNKQTINMTMLDGTTIGYNVYVSSLTTQAAFNVTYIF